jgi:hypothetical protein
MGPTPGGLGVILAAKGYYTVPPLQFGLQRWGVRLHLFLAGSRGVLRGFLAFELLLRGPGRLQGWSGYCISPCEHQAGYRGQWRD